MKKGQDPFDVTIGSFDGAESCDLCGLFLLSQLAELAKGRQCGHVATLNALYRWELNPIDENQDTEPSRVEEEGGPLVFPGPLQKKLSRWLNGDPDLLQEAELQKVVQVKVETQIHEIT